MSRSSIARTPHALELESQTSPLVEVGSCASSSPTRRLTALIVSPTLEAGASDTGAIDTIGILTRAGHRVIVVSKGGRLEPAVTDAGAAFVRLDVASKNPFRILVNVGHLASLIKRERCEIVHAHGRTAAWSAYLAARFAAVPFITSWYKGFREQNFFKRIYNSVMARGERVIATNDQIAELVIDRHHAAGPRVAVVPPGIDPEAYDPTRVTAERVEAVRRDWGVKPGTRVILVLGRMLRRKGHHVVIRAINRLKERGLKDFVCVFIGEDGGQSSYVGELWDLVLTSDSADIVRLPAASSDLAAAYAAATVAVSAAVQPEGVQRAVLEAQAMKIPVVVSDLAAGADVVLSPPAVPDDRMTGLRIPAGDESALAAALIRFFSLSEPARRAIGERGRTWVLTHFDRDAAAEQILAIYSDLARAH